MNATVALACLQAIARVAIGLLLAVAAAAKLARRDDFRDALAAYRLLPLGLVIPFALLLPLIELPVGVALMLGLGPVPVLLAAGLMLLFAGAIAINLLRGRTELDCGCNPGAPPEPIRWALVARNIGFTAALLFCLVPTAPLAPDLWLTAGVTGALLFAIGRIFSTLRRLAPPARLSSSLKA